MSESGRYIASFYVTFSEPGDIIVWIPTWAHKNPKKETRESVEGIIRKYLGEIPVDIRKRISSEIKACIEYAYGRVERCHDDHDKSAVIFQVYTKAVTTLGGSDMREACGNVSNALLKYAVATWSRKKKVEVVQ